MFTGQPLEHSTVSALLRGVLSCDTSIPIPNRFIKSLRIDRSTSFESGQMKGANQWELKRRAFHYVTPCRLPCFSVIYLVDLISSLLARFLRCNLHEAVNIVVQIQS
jgi:hypothetical protein